MSDEQHEGEPNPRIDDACDSLATQLEQMRRDLADLRARGVVPDADCTCGSGGHPRPCAKHPHRMEMHAREIDTENALEQMRREREQARLGWERAAEKDRAYGDMIAQRDALQAEIDATWTALGVIGRGRGVTLPERAAKVVAARDGFCDKGVALTQELAEARATNARLHRRAQGVEAGKPEDEETIRRLRAEVVATAKHAGHVAGHVYRLQMAANFAQHATSMAVRERDEARAHAEERTAKVRDLARCAAASEARASAYAAKLERVRDALVDGDVRDDSAALLVALRIIDEKAGGM